MKLSRVIEMTAMCPSMLRNTRAQSVEKNWPTTGTLSPFTGSMNAAKPSPVCMATTLPARTKVWERNSVAKPMSMPMSASRIVTRNPGRLIISKGSSCRGRSGTMAAVTATENTRRMKVGIILVPKTTMTIIMEESRTKGQKYEAMSDERYSNAIATIRSPPVLP